MKGFQQFVYTVPGLNDPALAIAASRAGAIGVFNAAAHHDVAQIGEALRQLSLHARKPWGLRMPDDVSVDCSSAIAEHAGAGLRWLIVSAGSGSASKAALDTFRADGGTLFLECDDWTGGDSMDGFDGLIVRLDAQSLAESIAAACAEVSVPVYAMGGLGMRAHAVCFAAGAAGIIYDTQMAGLAESPLAANATPPRHTDSLATEWARKYANVAGVLRAADRALQADLDSLLEQFRGNARDQLVIVPRGEAPADVVAKAGETAVPVIQFDAAASLEQAAQSVGERTWGVQLDAGELKGELAGVMGQCRSSGASFALLRNARPDQALAGVSTGLPSFLPVHSASLLELCLRQGITHFVCEAASLQAWSMIVETLGTRLRDGLKAAQLTVLVRMQGEHPNDAGRGAALLAPLAALGIHTGFVVEGVESVALPDRKMIQNLRKRRQKLTTKKRPLHKQPADIAIVGIGCKLPRAGDAAEYWDNMLDRVNGIQEIPADRWDWRLYFDEDRHAEDRIYSRWGGFLDDVPFDPLRFGMPPKSINSIDPMQLMALEVVRQTIEDAGYAERDFNRERVSIVLGATGGTGDVGAQYAVRAETPRYAGSLPEDVAERLPQWTEDSFAGILLNVTAGRAANRFDFGGVNFTVDSACASSLTAVYQAVTELEAGRSDMAIAGGVDTVQGPFGYLCFSKTQALSPRGQCSTFDQSADGIVISEGIAMVALKRLADAERDGDRIYAVIKGVGGSSDGRARSMTAPHPDGQVRALQRAYEHAGYSPATVGLFEAHGTGTVAGDTAELETVIRVLEDAGAKPHATVIGSVKTLIGHTKGTAGIAGLVKTALAVYHGVQPPHANVTTPNERISRSDSPVSLLPRARPWISPPETPRRASVSAFGFGGTNFHVTMEQYQGDYLADLKPSRRRRWPAELLLWRGSDAAALAACIRATAGWLSTNRAPRLNDLAWTLQKRAPATGLTACIVATATTGLATKLARLADHVVDAGKPLPEDAFFAAKPLTAEGGVAVVFAGQGAQYPDMLRQVAVAFDDLGDTLAVADATLGRSISALVYPPGRYDEAEQKAAYEELAAPADGLPGLAATQVGMLRLFKRLGMKPMMAAGHSFGEYAALHAAGVLTLEDMLKLAQARGETLAEASDNYALARVAYDYNALVEAAAAVGDVWVASHTAPGKCTVSGVRSAVLELLKRLQLPAETLSTSVAVHTPLAAASARQLFQRATPAACNAPEIPVYCNATAQPYSASPDVLLTEFSQQLARPVRFVEQIEAMYEAGARIFLGLGPRNGQGSPIVDILGDKPYLAVHVDDGKGGMLGLLRSVGALLAQGVALNMDVLGGGRDSQVLEMDRPNPGGSGGGKKKLPRHYWLLNSSAARPAGEPARRPLMRADQALPPAQQDQILKTEVPAKKGTSDKWENLPMSTTAKEMPAQLLGSSSDDSHDYVVTDERDVVFQAYQDTMRQFLSAQENVMLAYLTGEAKASAATLPRSAPRRLPQPRAIARRPSAAVPLQVAVPPVVAAPVPRPAAPAVAPARTQAAAPKPVNGAAVEAKPAAAPKPAAAQPAASMGADDIRKQLLALVEDRTGYPQDMLDLHQHIEADLGIDSIKRVEIVGALIKALPAAVVAGNGALSDELNGQTTLQGMIDLVSAQGMVAAASNQ